WGLGYFGQPHIIVRFMALRSAGEAVRARRIGISWMVFSLLGAVATALVGLAYFRGRGEGLDNPETVFIELGQAVFHPLVAGVMLAAVLAAIMSTISSQLLVTSSALVEDIYQAVFRTAASQRSLVLLGRLAVLVVALVAIWLAWAQDNTILGIVAYAWAGFGASFGPVVLLALWWRRLTASGALAGIVTGAVTVVVWGNIESLSSQMYEIVPGFVLSTIAAVVVSLATHRHDPEIEAEFERSAALAR
ncbi:MAG TPA: sodium:proline symporter, partial [Nocardioides sp.]